MMEATEVNVERIPLDSIVYAVKNHRKTMDPDKLQELADSIAAIGVQQPVKVCQRHDPAAGLINVLIFGHRRVKASEMAGLESIPAIIVEDMTNQQIAEAQVIENIQREDLGPMDEARCVETLISGGYDIEQAAAKMGKCESWARGRLDLLRLDESIQEFVNAGRLPLGHAMLLSRVGGSEDQLKLARSAMGVGWQGTIDDAWASDFVAPLRAVRKEIEYLLCKMGSARWPHIGEYAGRRPCAGCPDNTNTEPGLFESLGIEQTSTKGNCTNPECFQAKAEAWEKDPVKLARDAERDAKKKDSAGKEEPAEACGRKPGESWEQQRKRVKKLEKQFPWDAEQRFALAVFDYGNRLADIIGQYIEAAKLSPDIERDLVIITMLSAGVMIAQKTTPSLFGIASGKVQVSPELLAETWRQQRSLRWGKPGICSYDGEIENVPLDDQTVRKIDELEVVAAALTIDNLPERPTMESVECEQLKADIAKANKADALELIENCTDTALLATLATEAEEGKVKLPKYKITAINDRFADLENQEHADEHVEQAETIAAPESGVCCICDSADSETIVEFFDEDRTVCLACYEGIQGWPKRRKDEVADRVAKAPLWVLEELHADGLKGDWRRTMVASRIDELKKEGR